jgi:hypothetical protein
MPELAEKFMVQAYGPVLTQKLYYIRNKAIIVSLAYFIQILNGKANKGHQ